MKYFPVIFLCFGFFIAFGQENSNSKQWEVELFFSPDYSYRLLLVNDEDFDWFKTVRDKNENAKFSYHTGYNICYKLKKKLSGSVGLAFYDMGWKTDNHPVPNESEVFHVVRKYRLCSFLSGVKYQFLDSGRRLDFFASLGLSLNGVVDSRSFYVYTTDGDKQYVDVVTGELDTRKFLLGLHFGAGISYKLNNKLSVIYQPGFSCWPVSFVDAAVGEYLYSVNNKFGITVGF